MRKIQRAMQDEELRVLAGDAASMDEGAVSLSSDEDVDEDGGGGGHRRGRSGGSERSGGSGGRRAARDLPKLGSGAHAGACCCFAHVAVPPLLQHHPDSGMVSPFLRRASCPSWGAALMQVGLAPPPVQLYAQSLHSAHQSRVAVRHG